MIARDPWEIWKSYVPLVHRKNYLKGEAKATTWEEEMFKEATTEVDKEIWRARILLKRLEYLQYWRYNGV